MDRRLTIGEFSRVTRLTRKALRLYDALGLLRPAAVDPHTGYRTYSLAQAPRARAIVLLRSVDMPLTDIGRVVDATDKDAVRLLLSHHRARLEGRLQEHREMLLEVERLLQRGEVMGLDVEIKELGPATLITEPFTSALDEIGPACGEAYGRIYAALEAAGVPPAGPPWLRYLDVDGETWSLEAGVPVPMGSGPIDGVERTELGPIKVAAALHRGPYSELGLAYEELEQWAAEHGHEQSRGIIDIYLNDPATVAAPDLETEVCVLLAD
jgi:DNA-binding transcriptional MerR regulator